MSDKKRGYRFDTIALHGGQQPDPVTGARAVPIYQTTSFSFKDTDHAARLFALEESGNIYTRLGNPTTDIFEKRVAMLERGAGALATASGMAAIHLACMNITRVGQEIVSSGSIYGGTFNLFRHTFPKIGIKVVFVDAENPENFRKAITDKTRLVFSESIGNPKLDVLDIEAVAEIAHDAGIPLMIDNTFPTPCLLRPIEFGADIVVHSTTKYIGGHGTSIGGIIVDSGKFDWSNGKFPELVEPDPSYHGIKYVESFADLAYITKARVQMLRDYGPAVSPFNAFLFLQGLETLHLRMPRHSENALKVARYLQRHKKVSFVSYPGLEGHPSYDLVKKYLPKGQSGVIGFGIKGGIQPCIKFINSVKLLSHLANIGDAKSLVIHPASTTHQQLTKEEREAAGVTDDFIRFCVGIEHVDDIIADLEQALVKA